ncbi:restriction endonuclease subunit S [Myroides fluvii]|uniref:restriction endonuclease subunit S n=1 Tax=Myroides fluvii TaxID=2572594 RepID=UPI00131AB915|nr:restriction endonuclease subunit S [Myroides fluvii]
MQKYKHYKDSGIDWIGNVPEHWEIVKLKHIFREKPKTLNSTLSAGSISFGKVIYKNDEKILESTKASYQEVLEGDFLINPLNLNYDLISLRIALSAINVVVSSGYIVLQDVKGINKEFYRWFLHQYDVSYMKLLGSGVRQTINFNHIANSLLAFPPIQEQEAIASFLDEKIAKIEALVQTKEQQIEKLKELRQAKIHQAVTKGFDTSAPTKDSGVEWIGEIPEHWEIVKLKHIFREKPKTLNSTLSAGSISFGKVIYKNDEKILESTKASYQEVLEGDFLINPLNLNYDLISLRIALSAINVVVSSGYIVLQDVKGINKEFYRWFLHQYDVSYMKLLGSGVRQTINFNHIANSLLAFPPIQEQEQIVAYLDEVISKIDQAIVQKQEQITKLKEYKQSLINDVVTGKVKVF